MRTVSAANATELTPLMISSRVASHLDVDINAMNQLPFSVSSLWNSSVYYSSTSYDRIVLSPFSSVENMAKTGDLVMASKRLMSLDATRNHLRIQAKRNRRTTNKASISLRAIATTTKVPTTCVRIWRGGGEAKVRDFVTVGVLHNRVGDGPFHTWAA